MLVSLCPFISRVVLDETFKHRHAKRETKLVLKLVFGLLFFFTDITDKIRKEGNVLVNGALNTLYLRLFGRMEGNVLFNDALNTFYFRLYGKGLFLYAPSRGHDSTYYGVCYTSRGALAGTRYSSDKINSPLASLMKINIVIIIIIIYIYIWMDGWMDGYRYI